MNVQITFDQELGFFLPPRERKNLSTPKTVSFKGKRQVIDFIQSFGVPHTEVGDIHVNGKPAGADSILEDNDRVHVHAAAYKKPVKNPRFLCDVHLWKMARRLRLLGFDTRFDKQMDDPELAETANKEKRFLLTRDRGLLMRANVTYGCYIRSTEPEEQVMELLERLKISSLAKPFSRCFVCNNHLSPIDKDSDLFRQKVKPNIPHQVLQKQKEFNFCRSCEKAYWKGSHYGKLREIIRKYG